jgi:V/A-type H+-transporting ATPase subunit I
MSLRPVSARWFELLTPREDLTTSLECLAETGAVELQAHSETPNPLTLPNLESTLEEFAELSRKYSAYWPTAVLRAGKHQSQPPKQILEQATNALHRWCAGSEPVIRQLHSLNSERSDLALLESLITSGADFLPEEQLLAKAGPVLGSAIFVMPREAWPEAIPASVITQKIPFDTRTFLVAVGPIAELDTLSDSARALKGRQVLLPDWLPGESGQARQSISHRIAEIDKSRDELGAELERLSADCDLPGVLGDLGMMRWFAEQVPAVPATERFAWVTGWTSDPDGRTLENALTNANVEHLLRFVQPPPGFEPPMILKNPRLIRPFEVFAGMLGTPATNEADPTSIVAVVAPLIFGFMFGDVGQGAIILLAGLILRRRYPGLGILVAGGFMAMTFGVLFGNVFAREDIIPALWMHPFEQPMTILLVSLLLGAAVLFVGLSLAALQAHWTGQGLRWWQTKAGLQLAYAGLVGALFEPGLLWLIPAGIVWFLIGSISSKHESRGIGAAAAESFEMLFQLIVNTISFVRVGAFALAHSGLSIALVGIAGSARSIWINALILIVGNAFIIVLEGLVVGIQTTRLVLFEFFVRFLTATGRQFLPLPAPDFAIHKAKKETA